mmetsp:Transcript_5412/g.12011  ORF Transcript_5412/g.12011 Transcript_5412/m.12011 type:complete len:133 (-) Transcript_5412:140-538(-)
MAPEVARQQAYNQTCDVFSFAIMLWEMLSLETPFAGITTRRDFYFRVSIGGERPSMVHSKRWPERTRRVLEASWIASPLKRPSIREVGDILEADVLELRERLPRNKESSRTWTSSGKTGSHSRANNIGLAVA